MLYRGGDVGVAPEGPEGVVEIEDEDAGEGEVVGEGAGEEGVVVEECCGGGGGVEEGGREGRG